MTRVFACALLAVTTAACSDLIDDPRDGFPTVDTGAVADAGDAALDATIDTPEPGDTGDASKVDAGDSGADAPLPDIPEPPPPTFDDLVGLLSVECAPCHTDRVSGELSLRDDAGLYDRLLTTSFQAPDVARVELGAQSYRSAVFRNGRPAVGLGVVRQSGSNTTMAAEQRPTGCSKSPRTGIACARASKG